jgi:cobalamin biosynthesis protein CobW
MKRIPALVVGGFLGSGKTTLVRRLLQAAQAEGARVAFVSNELGELGIDQALLGGGQESFVELAGGCVCCALNDELYDNLRRLRDEVDPDRIVIECSGVAVPHDVQITFYQQGVVEWISEEAVAVVVDALTLDDLLSDREVEDPLKVDLVHPSRLVDLEAAVVARNPGVPVLPSVHGDVDPRLLLQAEPRLARGTEHPDHDHTALHGRFHTREVQVPDGLTAAEVHTRLSELGALRVKGFVQTDLGVAVVQGVGRRLEVADWQEPVAAALIGRVVVITRDG